MDEYGQILAENLGKKLNYYKEVDSTNTVAKKKEKWEHGEVIIAKTQTAGRGTYGRTFFSKADCGIYLTVIIDINKWHFKEEKLATIYTAVAVVKAVYEVTKIPLDVKWVNDLFLNSKKIGGILTEKSLYSNKLVIGIGINIAGKKQDFPTELQDIATSLGLEDTFSEQAAKIAIAIYENLLKEGELSNSDQVLKLYKEKLFILGETVDVLRGNDVFEVQVVDVDASGRLIVYQDGKELVLDVGEVRVKRIKNANE